MSSSSHMSGTVAVANGSVNVVGTGSTWKISDIQEGDLFCALGLTVRIASVTSNGALVLALPWPGATLPAGSAYEIRYTYTGDRSLSTLNDVLTKINLVEEVNEEALTEAINLMESAVGEVNDSVAAAATSASNAATSEINANNDAAASALSATNAHNSEIAAGNSATTALAAKDDTLAAKGIAEDKAAEATLAAGQASNHADTTVTKAGEAATSASDAEAFKNAAGVSAGNAEAFKNTASTKAAEASDSAAAALNHKNDTLTAKDLAEIAAGTATTKAAEAAASAVEVEAALESLEGGPVVSIAGLYDIVTLEELGTAGLALANDVYTKTYIDGALAGKAAIAHTHSTADITGLDTALSGKANLSGATFLGPVNVATQAAGNNSTLAASTAFVSTAIGNLINAAPGLLDTLDEIAAALGDDPNFATTMTTALSGKQGLNANLTAMSGLTGAADRVAYFTGSGAMSLMTVTSVARSLLDDTTFSAMLTTIGAQAVNTALTAISSVTPAADRVVYFTGSTTASLMTFTSLGRSLVAGANQAAMLSTLGAAAASHTHAQSQITNLESDLAAKANASSANTFSGPQRVTFTTLSDSATVTPNLNDNNAFILTLGGNRTIANPSNIASAIGQEVLIVFRGAYQPSFGSYYKFPGGTVPTFSGSLNAIGGTVISSTEILMHGAAGYA